MTLHVSLSPKRAKERKKTWPYLLGRDIEGHGPEVHFLVGVDAGNDEKDTRALGTSFQEATESEDDSPFVFLHHLKNV